jgi:RNA polymerase sigma-70 factor, ECF subfamily
LQSTTKPVGYRFDAQNQTFVGCYLRGDELVCITTIHRILPQFTPMAGNRAYIDATRSVPNIGKRYCDTAGAKVVAHIAGDRRETSARDGNRGCAHATASLAPSVTVGEGLQHEIEALLPRLRRYALVLTRDVVAADDLVQDSLTSALRKIHMWEPGTDLRAWLFTILHNHHVNNLRRDARHRAGIEAHKPYRTLALMPDQNVKLEVRDVERALAKLPEDQRSLILLVGMEGMRYEDAAAAFKLPLGTVRSRIARGRDRLRSLTDRCPPSPFEVEDHKEVLQ